MEEFDQPLPKIKSAAAANKTKSYDGESDEEDEEESVLLEEDKSFSEIEEEEEREEQEGNPRSSYRMFPPVNDRETILYLWSTWSETNLHYMYRKKISKENTLQEYTIQMEIENKIICRKFLKPFSCR